MVNVAPDAACVTTIGSSDIIVEGRPPAQTNLFFDNGEWRQTTNNKQRPASSRSPLHSLVLDLGSLDRLQLLTQALSIYALSAELALHSHCRRQFSSSYFPISMDSELLNSLLAKELQFAYGTWGAHEVDDIAVLISNGSHTGLTIRRHPRMARKPTNVIYNDVVVASVDIVPKEEEGSA
eukprot:scaffold69317_cov77-Cyclotella_meneghiniana.AAC.3